MRTSDSFISWIFWVGIFILFYWRMKWQAICFYSSINWKEKKRCIKFLAITSCSSRRLKESSYLINVIFYSQLYKMKERKMLKNAIIIKFNNTPSLLYNIINHYICILFNDYYFVVFLSAFFSIHSLYIFYQLVAE